MPGPHALLGAHVDSADPLAAAAAVGAQAVQFFLADPQSWKKPVEHARADELRATELGIYIHAPYLVNVASTNNRIRIPSRKILAQHAEAAAGVGARGLIVHGGHVTAGDDPAEGIANWRKTLERARADGGYPLPILIENTAGGENAMARRLDRLARLWDAVGDLGCRLRPGHLPRLGRRRGPRRPWSTGCAAITGRIDLVHANNSRDAFDSGADRHANLATGTIDAEQIAKVCAAAGCDVIVETPAEGQRADLAFLRERLDEDRP